MRRTWVRPKQPFVHGVVLALVMTGVSWLFVDQRAAATVDPPVNAGDVVATDNSGRALAGGGSATEFRVRLPEGATCPGDTLNDDWRVQSFISPVVADPGKLDYGVVGPEGQSQFALFDLDTRPFANRFIPPNVEAGKPALIGDLPSFSFAVLPVASLPDGRYRIGIACTYFRVTDRYWSTEIVVAASPNDAPSQFTWRLANAPNEPLSARSESNRWIAFPAVLALVAAIGMYLWRRSARRTTTLSKEPQ